MSGHENKTKQNKTVHRPRLAFPGEFSVLDIRTQRFYFTVLLFRLHFATFANFSFPFLQYGPAFFRQRSVSSNLKKAKKPDVPMFFEWGGCLGMSPPWSEMCLYSYFFICGCCCPKWVPCPLGGGLATAKLHIKWHMLCSASKNIDIHL